MSIVEVMKQIDSLPPLPQTVMELESFKKSSTHEIGDLIKIIEKDPLIVSTLLKVSNSAMFGFVSKIETPSRAVNLLGINFTLSIAIASSISKIINTDLSCYGKTSDDFIKVANMQSNFINVWFGKIDKNLRDQLILPAFLQESGKFLINDAILQMGQKDKFFQEVSQNYTEIEKIEQQFLGISTAEVTSAIFQHWGLDENLVNDIMFADKPQNANLKAKPFSQILHVVKLIFNIIKPLDEVCIQEAKKLILEYGYQEKSFDNAILKIQDRLLDEKKL